MDKILLLPILISFALSVVLCKLQIPMLVRLKFGQQVRDEGNPEHKKKQGTPTMGGIAYLVALLITCLCFAWKYTDMIPTLLLTMGFALVGFTDDFLKIKKKQSEGLNDKQKFACQTVFAILFVWYLYKNPAIGSEVILPFTGGKTWDMGWLYLPFAYVAIMGTDNGTNFTDGLDGLCSSVTVVVAMFLLLVAGNEHGGIAVISGAMAGALLGFLFYNSHPAKVFMGDTGALALGGFVAGSALTLRMGWFILIFGFIYLLEVTSVILQVGYFKITKGKRIFKMAPIHHHYELCGYSETQIVAMFTAVTLLLCAAAYMAK